MKVDTVFQDFASPLIPILLVLQSTKDGMTYLRRLEALNLECWLALLYGTTNARPTVYVYC